MAQFEPAFKALMKLEGLYNNDPADRGGETYRGISRNNWRGWSGWEQIDRLKKDKDFPANLERNADLQARVHDFYLRYFWMPCMDQIADQAVATWLFEKGVNMGFGRAVRLVQQALHVDADGVIGPQTMRKLNATDPARLLADCRDQAKRFYTKLALDDPSQTKFLHGWLARA